MLFTTPHAESSPYTHRPDDTLGGTVTAQFVFTELRGSAATSSESLVSDHETFDLVEKGHCLSLLKRLDDAGVIEWDRETDRITGEPRLPTAPGETC